MQIKKTAFLAALTLVSAGLAPAAEDKVWTTYIFDTPEPLQVSTQDTENETVEALAATYGILSVETSKNPTNPNPGLKHIVLGGSFDSKRLTKGNGPTALTSCTDFDPSPGAPFVIDGTNLPLNEDFNVTSTTNVNDWRGACVDGISSGDGQEAFVQFTPDVTGSYLLEGNFFKDSNPGVPSNAALTIWELPGCTTTQPTPAASTQVACQFDLFGSSQLVASLTAGTTYYVILEDQFGTSAEDTAQIRLSGPLAAPAGENASKAIDLSSEDWGMGFSIAADSTPNSDQGDSNASCRTAANPGPDVWFVLPDTFPGQSYLIDLTAGTLTDSMATLYSGSPGSLVEEECNDDKSGTDPMSALSFTADAGKNYFLQVESWSFSGVGAGTFTLNGQSGVASASNWMDYE